MKLTKKAFEEHLNELYGVDTQRWGTGRYGASSRPYGTYFRNADPEKFNIEYEDWCAEQSSSEPT